MIEPRYRLQQSRHGSWHVQRALLGGIFWWTVAVRTPLSRAVEWLETKERS